MRSYSASYLGIHVFQSEKQRQTLKIDSFSKSEWIFFDTALNENNILEERALSS